MQVTPLAITGAWQFAPLLRGDDRGVFLESFTESSFLEATGQSFTLKQMNVSVSKAGTVRGIHFADVPPGQAKYVQCFSGRILDIVVDLRVGSPTFGQWASAELNDETRHGLYISEGLGHAFCALSEQATVGYLCSEPYAPTREHGIHPLDPDLDLPWPPGGDALLSAKDASAPTLREAREIGLLPDYRACQELIARLARPAPG